MKKLLVISLLVMGTIPALAKDPNLKKSCVSPTMRVAASAINERAPIQPRKATTATSQSRTATR
jgi:hypothetical protein